MQLNDYKINRKLLKFTNNINFIGKNKYLSRESSANKMEQSIYKSLSSSQLLTKSHRDNNNVKNKIQEISTMGSIYSKDSAYFNNVSNEQLNIPPIRSLNKEDGDKLIANLNKQIKQQNLLISKLKQQIITQSSDLDNLSKISEQFLEKQQSYEEITQNYHSSNQKIQQLAQIREIQPYTNDYLEIVTQIYTDDYQLQVATQWRNQKLKVNFIRNWLNATKSLKLINNFAKKLEKNKLQQFYQQWKRFLILKQSLFEFNQVKELRIKILHWKQWKNHILTKKQYDKNCNQAIKFYSQKMLFKYFQRLTQLYLQNNYQLTVFQNLQYSARQQLGLLRQFQVLSQPIFLVLQQVEIANIKQKIKLKQVNCVFKIKISDYKIKCVQISLNKFEILLTKELNHYTRQNQKQITKNIYPNQRILSWYHIQIRLNQIKQTLFYEISFLETMDLQIQYQSIIHDDRGEDQREKIIQIDHKSIQCIKRKCKLQKNLKIEF